MIKIAIITVCYNAEKSIRGTVESVLGQTYPSIEYLVIDGGSTDSTLDILSDYSNSPIMKVYSEKDEGIYNAMNRGIARAKGDYILFLNAGDTLYDSEVIEDAIGYIQEDMEAIYYGKVCRVSPNRPDIIVDYDEWNNDILGGLLKGNMPCHQAILASKNYLRNHYFREKYQLRADFEWLVYSIGEGAKCIGIPTIICNFEDTGISGAVKSMQLMQSETQEILNQYASNFQDTKTSNTLSFEWKQMSDKHLGMFLMVNRWIMRKQEGFELDNFLVKSGIQTVAIYGMSYIGENVLRELEKSSVNVKYGIDRNAVNIKASIDVYSDEDTLGEVDAVIVTTLTDFSAIKTHLSAKLNAQILSLEDILFKE